MSDTDGFIEEVTEEVRKDQLFGYFKKYGWIAAVVIVGSVGGAAYLEWSKSQAEAVAQARGDAITAALSNENTAEQITALDSLSKDAGASFAVLALQKAALQVQDGQKDAALATLDSLAASDTLDTIYRDMATFKALMLRGKDADPAARMAALDQLAIPGNPFRPMALEQMAVAKLDEGDKAGAIELLSGLLQESEVSPSIQQRATQLLVSLGGELPSVPQLLSDN
ncbi:hypothetical protein F9L33_05665 [Amylibacter sp. SFDW26]|uniref:hypothetical protein n=1 Tax=Amylibacter sp. SFDW26 TaxID=2652722 RepID=UPI0012615B7D|nr:hypothetical protein [Amylibacter sp. SFDW26]KAB7616236.1 hypothetical protein F9L33_05665 [Amylibacter sp. SFDW26]